MTLTASSSFIGLMFHICKYTRSVHAHEASRRAVLVHTSVMHMRVGHVEQVSEIS